jgi:hypothetical protein
MMAYTLTNNSLTVVIDYKDVYTTTTENPNWDAVLEALKAKDEKEVVRLVSIKNTITAFSEGNIKVVNDKVFYKNQELHGLDVERLLGYVKNKFPADSMVKFLENKQKNPSSRSINELYKFLEHRNMPVDDDGMFLAYKGVQVSYFSKHGNKATVVLQGQVNDAGQIRFQPGDVIEVQRNSVCDDYKIGCAEGIHVGSLEYATGWAGTDGKVVTVRVNPADVVSVPEDCSFQKLRCCKLQVMGEFTGPLPDVYCNTYSDEDEDSDGWDSDLEDQNDEGTDYEDENDDESGYVKSEDEECGCSCCNCQSEDEEDGEDYYDDEEDPYNQGYNEGYEDYVADPETYAKLECYNDEYIEGYAAGWADAQKDEQLKDL